jgi:uncharacterized protein YeaO (DUF488 family)
MHLQIKLKRAYQLALPEDGYRILVDRLWPRGVSKEKAALDEWAPELAPTTALRKFFYQSPDNWDVFEAEYRRELAERGDETRKVLERAANEMVTLVYAAKDEEQNHAQILLEFLRELAAKTA